MIRNFNPITETFLSNLRLTQKRSERASTEVSSGYRVSAPSDSPDDVVTLMRIDSNSRRTSQVQTNLTRLMNEVTTADSTLQIAITVLDRANVLGAQALGVGLTAEQVEALGIQVKDLQQEMVNLSQVNVQGRYIFSGDRDQAPQFTLDPTNTETGVLRAFDTSETRQITDMFGNTFTAAVTAEEIFDRRTVSGPTEENVFAALESLRQGLMANDPVQIGDAIAKVKAAGEWLNTNLAYYGAVENRVQESQSIAAKYQSQWIVEKGEIRDTDYAAAISELTATKTQESASLAAQAQFGPRSLFDYLK